MRRLKIRIRWVWRSILRSEGSPQAIGRGFAIGLLIGMSPFIGLHSILVLALTTLFKGNKVLGLATSWMSNPFTFAPLFWIDYEIGSRILSIHQPVHALAALRQIVSQIENPAEVGWVDSVLNHAEAVLSLGWEILGPIILGGLILGAVLAVSGYFLMAYAVRTARQRRSARRHALYMKPPSPGDSPGSAPSC